MSYTWDSATAAENVLKHGVALEAAYDFNFDTATVDAYMRVNDPERRLAAVGFIGGRLHVLVYVIRRTNVRIISLRKANRKEIDSRAG